MRASSYSAGSEAFEPEAFEPDASQDVPPERHDGEFRFPAEDRAAARRIIDVIKAEAEASGKLYMRVILRGAADAIGRVFFS